jgi:methylenetetrahydrofolate dehydrogenase (NADP+) / methenyltetrahydrofolate cyclohydrolase
MARLTIDGKAIAEMHAKAVASGVQAFVASQGIAPTLAVVLIGDNPASEVYVRNKVRQTLGVGMKSVEHRLAADTTQAALLALVASLNADPAIDGILVQLPLPASLDADAVIDAIDPAKDVDGLTTFNAGALVSGRPGLVPCTPLGSMLLIESVMPDVSGKEAVVIGRSNLFGKPMAQLLLAANATVTIAHSRSADLPSICRRADILVAAVGRAEMVRGSWVKPGALVIDVGINRVAGAEPGKTRLVGDVAYAEVAAVASAITPVPGGVGPMTIACLLRNTLEAACRRRGIAPASG